MGIEDEEAWENDQVLGQTVALFDQRGDQEAFQLLLDVTALDFERAPGSDWTNPIVSAVLSVESHVVPLFTEELFGRISETLMDVARRRGHHHTSRVEIREALPEVGPDWRTYYADRVGARPSNQARRERTASTVPTEDGLALASQQERIVYLALKDIQAATPEDKTIAIAPLPGVRLRAGHTWSPDITVFGNGRVVIFEVDGPHHRDARRYADDRNRDLQWQRCGVPVVRLPVEDLADRDQLAKRLKEELIRHLWPR
ncbi:hypothetical protein E6W39_21940 [Kitasatospora acidiphila]|uniref:DUF559 domain-containing protein n=1 Tax=Kitasatospora acidiphila TaxID=2567942 RepID=A0A540W5T7_9ACTN|nr:hypothetical protein [Kitasatospora acidiphila]TQF04395.1 hypothetical protein E6W39_21940 [Kitasatospora acidiphila]